LYAQKLLPTEAFAQSSFYTQKFLHIERSIYTEKLLHTEASTLHTEAFTHRSFYAQKLLHREAFTQRSFYTRKPFRTTMPEIAAHKPDLGAKAKKRPF
jgi:hypothetical protein